jgi:hypothetical protein
MSEVSGVSDLCMCVWDAWLGDGVIIEDSPMWLHAWLRISHAGIPQLGIPHMVFPGCACRNTCRSSCKVPDIVTHFHLKLECVDKF